MKRYKLIIALLILVMCLFGCSGERQITPEDLSKTIADISLDENGNIDISLVDGRLFSLGNIRNYVSVDEKTIINEYNELIDDLQKELESLNKNYGLGTDTNNQIVAEEKSDNLEPAKKTLSGGEDYKIVSGSLRVRKGPGVSFDSVDGKFCYESETVRVYNLSFDSNDNVWAQIGVDEWICIEHNGTKYATK